LPPRAASHLLVLAEVGLALDADDAQAAQLEHLGGERDVGAASGHLVTQRFRLPWPAYQQHESLNRLTKNHQPRCGKGQPSNDQQMHEYNILLKYVFRQYDIFFQQQEEF
jgi:hypothetical protein